MRYLHAALFAFVAVGVYNCGSSDQHDKRRGAVGGESNGGQAGESNEGGSGTVTPAGGKAGTSNVPEGGAAGAPPGGNESGRGGEPNVAGAAGAAAGAAGAAAGADAGGAGGATFVVLPDAPIVNIPYTCESPFANVEFDSYFHLDDFENGMLSAPGVTSTSTTTSANSGSPSLVDSVDCDDGVVDGTCVDCDALFSGSGSIQVTFDAQVLGALPTHVGMVWTDGGFGSSVTVTGYDSADQVIYTQTVDGIGDNSNTGTTAEDRFFGIVHYAGVKSVKLANNAGGIEIDHLQYGR